VKHPFNSKSQQLIQECAPHHIGHTINPKIKSMCIGLDPNL
jgi:hypothetical protein